jgi:hypothetical protein
MNHGRGHMIFGGWGSVPKKPMVSVYINNTWVHQQGGHWIAKAGAFSENDNDVTISACHVSPELAYNELLAGTEELRLLPADWDEKTRRDERSCDGL